MKKTLITILCTVLACSCVMGVTLAFLMDKTDSITNTFTIGKVDIELDESANLDLKMIPGKTITKDPKVTVKAGSEACWLFVKIEESANLDTFITYGVNTQWTALTGVEGAKNAEGVYYIQVAALTAENANDVVYNVLAENKVTVIETVTQTQLAAATGESAPKLTFTAYAVQQENLTVAAAWDQAQNAVNYPAANGN